MKDPVHQSCSNFTVTVHEHIHEIPPEEWDALICNTMFHTHAWVTLMEHSVREDVTPYYITVMRENHLVGGVICYITSRKVWKFRITCVACAYPISYETTFFMKEGEDAPTILSLLYTEIERLAREKKVHSVVITYADETALTFFKKKGFCGLEQIPTAYLYVQWKTFKEYLASLPRKTKKNIRHTLNQGERRGLSLEHSQDFSGLDHLFSLYVANLERHKYEHLVPFTAELYKNIEKYVREYAYILRCRRGDDLLGYWIYFFDGTFASMAFSGFDWALASEYDAYFNICYDVIREMIEKGCKRILFGATTYTVKRRIGCTLKITVTLVKFMNPLLNVLVKCLSLVQNFWVEYKYPAEAASHAEGS